LKSKVSGTTPGANYHNDFSCRSSILKIEESLFLM
jgi:hypothetical protein